MLDILASEAGFFVYWNYRNPALGSSAASTDTYFAKIAPRRSKNVAHIAKLR